MLLDNVVFTRGAAAHLPDKPLIAFTIPTGGKGVMVFYSAATTRLSKILPVKFVLEPMITNQSTIIHLMDQCCNNVGF